MNDPKREIIKLNNKKIGDLQKPYLIAEIGTNHNRDINIAKKIIEKIAIAGFDCAKFQTYESYEIVSENVRAKDYKLDSIYGDISAFDMFNNYLKTPKEWFPELIEFCKSLGLDCATTIHGEHGINWVKNLNFDLIKIASMDHNNFPFLEKIVNQINQPILISFGMAELKDIEGALDILMNHKKGVGALHCVSIYPATPKNLRLSNINFLREKFSIPIGFSDHTEDILSSSLGFLLGSSIFEKHVTLDKKSKGPDHPFALEPNQMIEYVSGINDLYSNLNKKEFQKPTREEHSNRNSYLKSVVAKRELFKDNIISEKDITLVRPGDGIPPSEYRLVIGCKVKSNIKKGNTLKWGDIEI